MTDERDFDRLARAWLELSPDRAPERSVAAVLQAVETTPQVRRRFRWLPGRDNQMTRIMPMAAVVAVIAVAAGGLFLVTRPGGSGAGATPMPSTVAPSPALSAGRVPEDLLGRWMSRGQSMPGVAADELGLSLYFGDASAALSPSNQWGSPLIDSLASGTPEGDLQLSGSANCPDGAIGDYSWSLSESGRRLSIAARSDPCAGRLEAIPGEWDLMGCKNTDEPCLGDLDPGTFASQFIGPRVGALDTWAPSYGELTYSVPAGWASGSDWPSEFTLTPSADYALWTKDGPPAETFHGIYLMAQPVPAAQTVDCTNAEEPGGIGTVDGLMDWVTTRPGLEFGESGTMDLGPHTGRWVDIRVDPELPFQCPDPNDHAKVALINRAGTNNDVGWWLLPNEQLRLIFVDIGQGDVVAIAIDSTDPDRFQELIAQAIPIVESFRFK
jgi:hypothetical protein